MSGRSRKASAHISCSSRALDGYSGRLDILTYRRRTWWQRLLRRNATPHRNTVYGNGKGDSVRAWRYPTKEDA